MKTTDELRKNATAALYMLAAVMAGAAIFVGTAWITHLVAG